MSGAELVRACDVCGHDETNHNAKEGCTFCLCLMTPEKLKMENPPEMVNHPAHYGGADDPFEHVKVAEAKGWDLDAMVYNATKYLWRLGKKDPAKMIEDLKKAVWYLNRRIQNLEKLQDKSDG